MTAPYKVERAAQIYTACQRCGQAIYSTEPVCTPCLIKVEKTSPAEVTPAAFCEHTWLYHHFKESTLDSDAAYIYYCQNDPHHMLAVPVKEVEWL